MRVRAQMKLVENEKVAAIGEVIIDDLVVIRDVKCLRLKNEAGEESYMVTLPNRKAGDEWRSILHIHDRKLWKELSETVLASIKEAATRDHVSFEMETSIRLFSGEDDLKAFASVMINDAIEIENIRIKEKEGQIKVIFPYKKVEDGIYTLAGPASKFLYERMEAQIIADYHLAAKKQEMAAAEPIRGGTNERSK